MQRGAPGSVSFPGACFTCRQWVCANAAGVIPFGYNAFTPSHKARHTNYLPKTHSGDGAYCNSKAPHAAAVADQHACADITPSTDAFLRNVDGHQCSAEGNWWVGLFNLFD